MAPPLLLQVLERAGVTTGRVEQLHFLMGAVWVSSSYNESWNYKQLSDNSQHDALEYLFTWDRGAGLSVTLSPLRVIMSYLDRNMLL